jgi:pimeloyl-ACP methyl ester carboxylesterase
MQMAVTQHIRRRIEIGELLPGEGPLAVAIQATLCDASLLSPSPVVFFCVPGGGLNSDYYNLHFDADARFSFADSMAARGLITIAIDPLGTGESSRPRDGFNLTPEAIARANALVSERVLSELHAGTFEPSLPRLPGLISVGVGHSLGGLFIVQQQVQTRVFDGVALLGFGTGGLPAVLDEELRSLAGKADRVRENIVRLARARYAEPYFDLPSDGRAREIYGGNAEPRAVEALREVRTCLLATASLFVIIPGSSAPAAAQVDVPVFLAVGTQDMCGPPHELPASFPGSSDVTLVQLPNTGHTHFVFASAPRLFERLAGWAAGLLPHGRSSTTT